MLLGVDLGKKTTGLAISESTLATPYKTITHKTEKEALTKIIAQIDELNIDTVILGFVEGKIKPFFVNFAKKLQVQKPKIKVILVDETLTSGQARQSMVKLGTTRQKRAQKEHEVAAALILQIYLDANE